MLRSRSKLRPERCLSRSCEAPSVVLPRPRLFPTSKVHLCGPTCILRESADPNRPVVAVQTRRLHTIANTQTAATQPRQQLNRAVIAATTARLTILPPRLTSFHASPTLERTLVRRFSSSTRNMAAINLDGKAIAQKIRDRLSAEIAEK